ncbi:GNAT family N-acetyltransferase [Planococcus salinarum]|uniref:GNAT family N-acetyltransferase n=1 Tax=Planococcus salinarum TaxID=622695 RepID=UPI000E3D8022|nr:GNAT family N-acetyltransferase [Planococcus salinarum]TAA66223.1 GNAT family N-acetyltransferase [Planococcus salinarum]
MAGSQTPAPGKSADRLGAGSGCATNHQQVRDKYAPRIDGKFEVEPYIAEKEGRPFAFLQCYLLSESDRESYGYSIEEIHFGIDQFIGKPSLFNNRYGTQMMMEFVQFIFHDKQADTVTVDPEVSHPRAIRCYEKCGFQRIKEIDGGRKWLMAISFGQ